MTTPLQSAEEFVEAILKEGMGAHSLALIRADRRAVALACADKCREVAERTEDDHLEGMGDLLSAFAEALGRGDV